VGSILSKEALALSMVMVQDDLSQVITEPRWVRISTSRETSVMSGTFFKVTGLSKSRVAGMRARTEFLEPEGLMVPERTWPPWILRVMTGVL